MTTSTDITTIALTTADEGRLVELEGIVSAGLETFVQVGTALAEIQTGNLYRATHDTFEAYLLDRFGISRPRGYELITSAATVTALSAMADVPVPTNERQARALAGLPAEMAAEVMTTAAEGTRGNSLTAARITATRDRLTEPAPNSASRPAPPADDEEVQDWEEDDPDAAFTDAFGRLRDEVNRLGRLGRFAVDTNRRLIDATVALGALAEDLRLSREPIDPLHAMVTELADLYPSRSRDALDQYVDSALAAGRKHRVDLADLRKRVVRDLDALSGVVIRIHNGNTALVESGWHLVRTVLPILGSPVQRDSTTKLMSFPARFVDDVQAALEADRRRCLIIRGDG